MEKVISNLPSDKPAHGEVFEPPAKNSLIGSTIHTLFIEPSFLIAVTYLNLIIAYIVIFALAAGYTINFWYASLYFPLLYILAAMRKARKEKDRLEIAHRIPYFTDALANALSLGSTLELAFRQASLYLRGKIKFEMQRLVVKNALGKNLGVLLRELDAKFPHTGLVYLISLLDAYSELGVGISPLLKRISVTLADKEKAEEKIRTTLAGGSGYARLAIFIFVGIFLALSYLLREQVRMLFSPELKPMFIFLCVWTSVGILFISRLTALDFVRIFALRPYIIPFMESRKLETEDLFYYSGIEWTWGKKQLLFFSPLLIGFCIAFIMSLYYTDPLMIGLGFLMGAAGWWLLVKFVLKGLVEDQLVKVVETFPEMLQVFTIGLNSGLNNYTAFQFAQNAIRQTAPKLLMEELMRTRFAMECGEDPARTWRRLSNRLPFETVVDFSDIMVVAPMHGESIVHSINHMVTSYQEKKLSLVEKKATSLSQLVIPIIIISFLPLFIFVIFAPMVTKIMSLF
jgi:Flp pilus assembly protein TadB